MRTGSCGKEVSRRLTSVKPFVLFGLTTRICKASELDVLVEAIAAGEEQG